MTKTNDRLPELPNAPTTAREEPRAYRDDPKARFAPADNLFDAIRHDVAPFGGIKLPFFERQLTREPPFNDIDENPHDE
jgi:hypothetical protein